MYQVGSRTRPNRFNPDFTVAIVDIVVADFSATLEQLKWGDPIFMEAGVKVEGEGIEDTVETTNSIAM